MKLESGRVGAEPRDWRMKQDRKSAWDAYLALCRAGGSKGYFELLALAGLDVPFAEGSVERAVCHVIDELNA